MTDLGVTTAGESLGHLPLLAVRWVALLQHLALFSILVICSTIVYHGLRRESVKEIVVTGLSRSLFFIVASLLIFGVGGMLLAEWL
jgi:hypothetical protein